MCDRVSECVSNPTCKAVPLGFQPSAQLNNNFLGGKHIFVLLGSTPKEGIIWSLENIYKTNGILSQFRQRHDK